MFFFLKILITYIYYSFLISFKIKREFSSWEMLVSKFNKNLSNVPNALYENRYCDQDEFSIVVCGGETDKSRGCISLNDVYELKGPNFECSKFPSMLDARYGCKTAVINSDILVVGGYAVSTYNGLFFHNYSEHEYSLDSVEIYKNNRKSWDYIDEPFDEVSDFERKEFCICSFKQDLYILGGLTSRGSYYECEVLKSCFVYNMKSDSWSPIADINEEKRNAACTLYEGKIVVSGGWLTNELFRNIRSKSVESYDFYENKWSHLADMIEERSSHDSVSMGNKLFVIGGHRTFSFETFDSFSRKFCLIKKCPSFMLDIECVQAVCIGNRIVIFDIYKSDLPKMFTYNDEINEWKLIECDFLQNVSKFSCVKYHK